MVLRPQTRQAFGSAAVGECGVVGAVHKRAAVRQERNHLSVAPGVGRFVIRSSDQKQGPGFSLALPARPRAAAVAKTLFQSDTTQHRTVKREGPVEV